MYEQLGAPGIIEIGVGREGDALMIRVCDQARPFDPHGVPPPDLDLPLEERPLGGLGVYMIRQLMDEMIYRAPPQGGNELTLVKHCVFGHGKGGQK